MLVSKTARSGHACVKHGVTLSRLRGLHFCSIGREKAALAFSTPRIKHVAIVNPPLKAHLQTHLLLPLPLSHLGAIYSNTFSIAHVDLPQISRGLERLSSHLQRATTPVNTL